MIAWGAAYLGAALVPAARKVVILAGGAGKAAYVVVAVAPFAAMLLRNPDTQPRPLAA